MTDCKKAEIFSDITCIQRNFMLETLNASRQNGTTDATVIVEDRRFPAHRWVLEANSPVFKAMFQSGMKEAITGQVELREMTASSMEAILDFFYVGKVPNSESELLDVLATSHRLFIDSLFEHCSYALGLIVCSSNVLCLWQNAEKFKSKILLEAVLDYVTENIAEIARLPGFLKFGSDEIKCLCEFRTNKVRNLDRLLLALLDWIRHDLEARENIAQELIGCLDMNLISKLCLLSLMEDSCMLMACRNIEIGLRNLAKAKDCCKEKIGLEVGLIQELNVFDWAKNSNSVKITFLCEEAYVECSGKSVRPLPTKCTPPDYYIQVLDVLTMTWQPATKLPSIQPVDSVCSYGKYIYMVGSYLEQAYIEYDMETCLLEYKDCANSISNSYSTLCYFKDYLWLLGGKCYNGDAHGAVYVLSPSIKQIPKWYQTASLPHNYGNPTVLPTKNHLYVTYDNNVGLEHPNIECITNVEWYNGEYFLLSDTITIPTYLMGLTTHFYTIDSELHGFCSSEDELLEVTYDDKKWKVQGFPRLPKAVSGVSLKCTSSSETPYIFVSTRENAFPATVFYLENQNPKWSKIDYPNGTCLNLNGKVKCVWM